MNFFQKIQYLLLVGVCKVVGLLPYRVLYFWFVDIIYFVLYKVVKYRIKVVRTNLENSFPEKSEDERRLIEKKFYKHLSEIFVDTIALCSLPVKKLKEKFEAVNTVEIEQAMQSRTWICAMAHYGSWEYPSAYKAYTQHYVIGVYRELHNKVFDEFFKYSRSRCGSIPVKMEDIGKKIIRSKHDNEKSVIVALIADQSPPWHTKIGRAHV